MLPVNIIANGTKKSLEIPENELRKPKLKQTDDVLPFISTFNYCNQSVYNTINDSVEVLKRIMFQDLKASNVLTVSENHLTLKNC